jgi:hypothetical protein
MTHTSASTFWKRSPEGYRLVKDIHYTSASTICEKALED